MPPELAQRYPEFAYDTGFVHEVTARRMQGKFAGARAYVAGPPPMVDAIKQSVLAHGLSEDRLFYGAFEFSYDVPAS